ncbi:hypothetical protein G9A89_012657 [Geosiphon pyriformis]|nr:hypothetical protein G9A89_012657 [Geosiphon pyriformis]
MSENTRIASSVENEPTKKCPPNFPCNTSDNVKVIKERIIKTNQLMKLFEAKNQELIKSKENFLDLQEHFSQTQTAKDAELTQSKQEIASLQTFLAKLQEEIRIPSKENEVLRLAAQQQHAEVMKLKEQLKQQDAQLKDQQYSSTQLEKLRNENERLGQRIKSLEILKGQLEFKVQEGEQIITTHEQQKKEIIKIKKELQKRDEQARKNQFEKTKLTEQLKKLQTEKCKIEEKVMIMEENSETLQDKELERELEISILKNSLSERDKQITQLHRQIEDLISKAKECEEIDKDLDRRKHDSEMILLKKEIEQYQKKLQIVESESLKAREELTKLKNEAIGISVLEHNNSKLQGQLQTAHEAFEIQQKEVVRLKTEIDKMNEMRQQNIELLRKSKAANDQIARLGDSLQEKSNTSALTQNSIQQPFLALIQQLNTWKKNTENLEKIKSALQDLVTTQQVEIMELRKHQRETDPKLNVDVFYSQSLETNQETIQFPLTPIDISPKSITIPAINEEEINEWESNSTQPKLSANYSLDVGIDHSSDSSTNFGNTSYAIHTPIDCREDSLSSKSELFPPDALRSTLDEINFLNPLNSPTNITIPSKIDETSEKNRTSSEKSMPSKTPIVMASRPDHPLPVVTSPYQDQSKKRRKNENATKTSKSINDQNYGSKRRRLSSKMPAPISQESSSTVALDDLMFISKKLDDLAVQSQAIFKSINSLRNFAFENAAVLLKAVDQHIRGMRTPIFLQVYLNGEQFKKFSRATGSSIKLPSIIPKKETDVILFLWYLYMEFPESDFLEIFLQNASEQIVLSKNKSAELGFSSRLCRIFIAICRLSNNLQRARVLCYDLLREIKKPDYIFKVLENIAKVWPQVLRYSILLQTKMNEGGLCPLRIIVAIVAIIAVKILESSKEIQVKEMYNTFVQNCLWEKLDDAPSISDTLRDLIVILQSPSFQQRYNKEALQGDFQEYRFNLLKSYELAAVWCSWDDIFESLVCQTLWPMIKDEKAGDIPLEIIGTICRKGLFEVKRKKQIEQLVSRLSASIAPQSNASFTLQKRAADVILLLANGDLNQLDLVFRWYSSIDSEKRGLLSDSFEMQLQTLQSFN